jgi:hypothetical protein
MRSVKVSRLLRCLIVIVMIEDGCVVSVVPTVWCIGLVVFVLLYACCQLGEIEMSLLELSYSKGYDIENEIVVGV